MFKKFTILTSLIMLSACAQVIASNEKQITIQAAPVAAAIAFQKAEEHCQQFDKNAVPSGTVFGHTTVFKCE